MKIALEARGCTFESDNGDKEVAFMQHVTKEAVMNLLEDLVQVARHESGRAAQVHIRPEHIAALFELIPKHRIIFGSDVNLLTSLRLN